MWLGLKHGAAGWKAQMNPLSYGNTPSRDFYFWSLDVAMVATDKGTFWNYLKNVICEYLGIFLLALRHCFRVTKFGREECWMFSEAKNWAKRGLRNNFFPLNFCFSYFLLSCASDNMFLTLLYTFCLELVSPDRKMTKPNTAPLLLWTKIDHSIALARFTT